MKKSRFTEEQMAAILREADRSSVAEVARFLVGTVLWKRGELEHEIKLGAWYVTPPETEVMMRKDTRSLWKELVTRQGDRRKAI